MKNNFGFAFVQFDNAESATAAIGETKHKIGGKTVKANVAFNQHQTSSVSGHSKPRKSNAASPINKLNDDCLREVFKRLNIADLLSTADVCKRFREVAKDLIKPDKYVDLEMNSTISWPLLRLFGPEIESIKLNFNYYSDYGTDCLLNRIAKLGSNPNSNLTNISITEWEIERKFINRLKPIFSRITSLSIDEAAKNDKTVAEMLNVCTELKELKLSSVYFGDISRIKFPKLETLIISDIPQLRDHMMDHFLTSHPRLKTLSMEWNTTLTSKAVRNINSNIEKLELLGCIQLSPNLDELNGLKSLKSLSLYGQVGWSNNEKQNAITSLAKKELPIEELHLFCFDLDEILNGIKFMKHLKKITLTSGEVDDNDQLVEIVKAHPQLKSIILDSFGEDIGIERIKYMIKLAPELEHFELDGENFLIIDSKDFESIHALVRNRPNKTKLMLVLSGETCKLEVPEILQKKSREWLEINVDSWCSSSSDEYDYDEYDYYNYDFETDSDDDEYDSDSEDL